MKMNPHSVLNYLKKQKVAFKLVAIIKVKSH